jgi:ribonuclease PH
MNKQNFERDNGRLNDQKRKVEIIPNYLENNPFSVLVVMGKTKVICTATTGHRMPPHVKDTGKGWVTAEYSMIPSASPSRIRRERNGARGRTQEIERYAS